MFSNFELWLNQWQNQVLSFGDYFICLFIFFYLIHPDCFYIRQQKNYTCKSLIIVVLRFVLKKIVSLILTIICFWFFLLDNSFWEKILEWFEAQMTKQKKEMQGFHCIVTTIVVSRRHKEEWKLLKLLSNYTKKSLHIRTTNFGIFIGVRILVVIYFKGSLYTM